MSFGFNTSARRDSWPPTKIVLSRTASAKSEPLPEDIDKDPLTYFLTPTTDDDEMELDEEDHTMMDFDAGIEDSAHPKQIVRSLSPSSLEGLRRGPRSPSPDFDSDDFTSDDEDNEDYIRFSPSTLNLFLQPEQTLYNSGVRSRSPVFYPVDSDGYLTPASFPAPNPRRSSSARRGLYRSSSARARQGHLWRSPSPDVWSIKEETEDQLLRDDGAIQSPLGGNPVIIKKDNTVPQLRKKVRFVLPPKEI